MYSANCQPVKRYRHRSNYKEANIVPSLLAAYALSGCDIVAHMFGISKAAIVKVLMKGLTLLRLGEHDANMDEIITEATEFVICCCLLWEQSQGQYV
jgi:hypothetical protein